MSYGDVRYDALQLATESPDAGFQGQYSYTLEMVIKPYWTGYGSSWASPPIFIGAHEMDTTFSQLQETHCNRLNSEKDYDPRQVIRNHLSVLNSFLAFCGKSVENRIGLEFTTRFVEQAQAFVDIACKTKKSAADKMSILRSWKLSVDSVIKASRRNPTGGESRFHKELRSAVAKKGEPINRIARNAHASERALSRWINGAFPVNGMPTLHRIEAYLGLERGHLEDLLPQPRRERDIPLSQKEDKYIARQSTNIKNRFYLNSNCFTREWIDEWMNYFRYKTAQFPVGLKRNPKGVWRLLPFEKIPKSLQANVLCTTMQAFGCATAERALTSYRGYFGFLILPKGNEPNNAGLGLPMDAVQTLAMCAIPEFLNGYLEFMKARSGNAIHSGHLVFAAMVNSLVRPIEGYLWQQPEFLAKIEQYARGRTWEQLCSETKEVCGAWERTSKGCKKSRDPLDPIRNILTLKDPLEPLSRAIKRLDEAAAAAAPGGVFQAIYKRDAILLATAISNPLRARTLTISKYVEEGVCSEFETNLYSTEAGQWRLRFFKGDFKNDALKVGDYDAPLPDALKNRIEEYISEYRPVLVRDNPLCPWLFPTEEGMQHDDLSWIIARIAKNYIPEVSRLRLHALRHIVATVFLRRNPGQFTVLAELLHDTLETVLKTYAHGKLESAFAAHEEHLSSFFASL